MDARTPVSVLIPVVSFRIQRVSVRIPGDSQPSCQHDFRESTSTLFRERKPAERCAVGGKLAPKALSSVHRVPGLYGTDNINETEFAGFVSSNLSVPTSALTDWMRTDIPPPEEYGVSAAQEQVCIDSRLGRVIWIGCATAENYGFPASNA